MEGYGQLYSASPSQIRQAYFEYLYDLVKEDAPERKDYWMLLSDLQAFKFYWSVEHDENRAQDGIDLRRRYLEGEWWANGEEALSGECSMLEMMIALAERMAFELAGTDVSPDIYRTGSCFWEMVENLGLTRYSDGEYERLNGPFVVNKTLHDVVTRNYDETGVGGIFPLRGDYGDQRYVELWYQMQEYLTERYDI
jgi:hypothetical protein